MINLTPEIYSYYTLFEAFWFVVSFREVVTIHSGYFKNLLKLIAFEFVYPHASSLYRLYLPSTLNLPPDFEMLSLQVTIDLRF